MRVGIIDIVLFSDEVLYCLSLDEGECKGCFAMPGVKRGNALIKTQIAFQGFEKWLSFVVVSHEYDW